MNKFEQQKKSAFITLLWVVAICILLIFGSIIYVRSWTTEISLSSLIGILLLILWLNKRYFSMRKAFYAIDTEWRACNSRLHALQEIQSSITKTPTLTKIYMQEWGYYDEITFTQHLSEEIARNTKSEKGKRALLEQIKTTPETSFIAYMKKYLWK